MPPVRNPKLHHFTILFLFLGLISGCASTSNFTAPNDPLENLNRSVYAFNDSLDRHLFRPTAKRYAKLTPKVIRRGVNNFFLNLGDVRSATNNLLQLKIEYGLSDLSRVLINSTIGIGGLRDVASKINILRHDEDFDQTLGYWGVKPGPYLVLPFLGPSSLRGLTGLICDWHVDPISYINESEVRVPLLSLRSLNLRNQSLSASNILDIAAIDPYAFVRDAYTQSRLNKVYDGNPPLDFDEDLFK